MSESMWQQLEGIDVGEWITRVPFFNDADARWWRCEDPNLDLNWEVIPHLLTDRAPYPYTGPPIPVGKTLRITEKIGSQPHVVYSHTWRIPDKSLGDYLRYTLATNEPHPMSSIEVFAAIAPPELTGTWREVTR